MSIPSEPQHHDADGRLIRVGDQILSLREAGEGEVFTVVALDANWVRVTGLHLNNFGKYPSSCRVVGDPDLLMDIGL